MINESIAEAGMVRQVLKERGQGVDLYHIEQSLLAFNFFKQIPSLHNSEKPGLVILDWELSGSGCLDLLQHIKNDGLIKHLPVLVFAREHDKDMVSRCYSAKANAFITKPADYSEYKNMFNSICDFWFETVKLPQDNFAY
jgi:CheY-like chemotaxis protein